MEFEFCWEHRHCNKTCPVRESQSVFCWRIAHKERLCHPDVCRRCSYRQNWFGGHYDLEELIAKHGRDRIRRKAQRILAIDDDPNFLFALEESVRELGCNCLTAIDGAEGLFFAQKTLPQLIVTDVNMPELNGFDLCRTLKADPRTADIPIIIVSVRAAQTDRNEGFAAGASDYFVKPLSPTDLERRIRALLPPVCTPASPSG